MFIGKNKLFPFILVIILGCSNKKNNFNYNNIYNNIITGIIDQKVNISSINEELNKINLELKSKPMNVNLQIEKGFCYIALKKCDMAEKNFKNILLNDSLNKFATLGIILIEDNRYNFNKVVYYANKLIKLDSTCGFGYYFRAIKPSNFYQNINDINKAIKLSPNLLSAYAIKATIYFFEADSIKRAFHYVNILKHKDPLNTKWIYLSLTFNENLKKYGNVISDCSELLKLDTSSTTTLLSTRGLAYEEKNEFNKAVEDYKLIANKDSSFSKYCLAGLYYKQKNYDLAYKLINTLISNNIYKKIDFLNDSSQRFRGINKIKKFRKLF